MTTKLLKRLVGATGIEPVTPTMSRKFPRCDMRDSKWLRAPPMRHDRLCAPFVRVGWFKCIQGELRRRRALHRLRD